MVYSKPEAEDLGNASRVIQAFKEGDVLIDSPNRDEVPSYEPEE